MGSTSEKGLLKTANAGRRPRRANIGFNFTQLQNVHVYISMTMTIDDMYLTVQYLSITKKSDICITVTYHAMFLTTQLWP